MDYEIVKLKEIADFNKESIGKNSNYEFINYLDTANITNGAIDTVVRIPIEEAPSRAKRIVHNNDIVYSTVRPNLCHYGILDSPVENMIVSTGFTVISCKDDVNPYYVYNYLIQNDITSQLHSIAENSTSAYPSIKPSDLENIEIKLPKLDIQNKIAKILTDIDKKIKINNEINNNLYEVSKQLLLKYLNENNNFEEVNISELLNVFTGKKNANETSPTGKYKFFSCAPENLLSDTYLYDGAAIIVAGNGAYTGRTRFYDGKFELYQRTYGLTLKDGFDKDNIYGLYVFMKTLFEPDKMGGTHGSAIPYIVLSDLTDYKLKYNKTEFDKFSNLVSSNIKMIQENEKYNEELSELRDTLLPKLMNGEIDLDNIEI